MLQLDTVELPVGESRQFRHEDDVSWCLEASQSRFEPGAQLRLVEWMLWSGLDIDPHHLALAAIGYADGATLGDGVVAAHDVLHLLDGDVLSADLEHELYPSDVRDVAVHVDRDEVLAVEPALGVDGPGRFLGLVPVAAHHVASDPRFADLTGVDVPTGLRVDDAQFVPLQHPPGGGKSTIGRVGGTGDSGRAIGLCETERRDGEVDVRHHLPGVLIGEVRHP